MKIIKSFIIAVSLALSLGYVSTAAATSLDQIKLVQSHIAEAVKAIDAGESNEVAREHVLASLRESKEITGTEMLEKNRLKASRPLKKARTALKQDDPQKAKEFLGEAEKKFEGLKKLL